MEMPVQQGSNVVSHETLIKDFGDLLGLALRINDHIGIAPDQSVIYEGSTNDVDDLRTLVNNLHYKYHRILDDPREWQEGDPIVSENQQPGTRPYIPDGRKYP